MTSEMGSVLRPISGAVLQFALILTISRKVFLLDVRHLTEQISRCYDNETSKMRKGTKTDIGLLQKNIHAMETMLQDFVKCMVTRESHKVCFHDLQLYPMKAALTGMQKEYKDKVQSLEQVMSEMIVRLSVKNVERVEDLRSKLVNLNFQLSCQMNTSRRRESNLQNRLKDIKALLKMDANGDVPQEILGPAPKHGGPCVSAADHEKSRDSIIMLKLQIIEKDSFIDDLQDKIKRLSEIVLAQRGAILTTKEIIRVQNLSLNHYLYKFKNISKLLKKCSALPKMTSRKKTTKITEHPHSSKSTSTSYVNLATKYTTHEKVSLAKSARLEKIRPGFKNKKFHPTKSTKGRPVNSSRNHKKYSSRSIPKSFGTKPETVHTSPRYRAPTRSGITPEQTTQTTPGLAISSSRTHYYHLENAFCTRSGHRHTYRPATESQNPSRDRLRELWLADVNQRFLDIPPTSIIDASTTIWVKVHSDNGDFYDIEPKSRSESETRLAKSLVHKSTKPVKADFVGTYANRNSVSKSIRTTTRTRETRYFRNSRHPSGGTSRYAESVAVGTRPKTLHASPRYRAPTRSRFSSEQVAQHTTPDLEIPSSRTHYYHLEDTFCTRSGHKHTYRPPTENRDPSRDRLRELWSEANQRFLDVPLMPREDETTTIWVKFHSDKDESFDLESKPRSQW